MWLAFTTNPHLLDRFDHRWTDDKREGRRMWGWPECRTVGLPGSGSNFCGSPQRKVPGSGISKLGCTSGCYQTLRSTAPGLQSGQVRALWEGPVNGVF